MKKIIRLENLDCAHCAEALERAISKVEGVKEANINFMALKLVLEIEGDLEIVLKNVKAVAAKTIPSCKLIGV